MVDNAWSTPIINLFMQHTNKKIYVFDKEPTRSAEVNCVHIVRVKDVVTIYVINDGVAFGPSAHNLNNPNIMLDIKNFIADNYVRKFMRGWQ